MCMCIHLYFNNRFIQYQHAEDGTLLLVCFLVLSRNTVKRMYLNNHLSVFWDVNAAQEVLNTNCKVLFFC